MEIDKTQLTHDVAAKIWEAEDPFGFKGPLEDQEKIVQFNLKMRVLPVLVQVLPVAETHVKDKIRSIISRGHSLGLSADMILLDLSTELGE